MQVFQLQDVYLKKCTYYIVAEDELEALKAGQNVTPDQYIDVDDGSFQETVIEGGEVETIHLRRKQPSESLQNDIFIIPTATLRTDTWHGYLARFENNEIDTEQRTWAEEEWEEVSKEEPLFEIVYTIHSIGVTQLDMPKDTTAKQFESMIDSSYENLNVLNCNEDSYDTIVKPLNKAARTLMVKLGWPIEEE